MVPSQVFAASATGCKKRKAVHCEAVGIDGVLCVSRMVGVFFFSPPPPPRFPKIAPDRVPWVPSKQATPNYKKARTDDPQCTCALRAPLAVGDLLRELALARFTRHLPMVCLVSPNWETSLDGSQKGNPKKPHHTRIARQSGTTSPRLAASAC